MNIKLITSGLLVCRVNSVFVLNEQIGTFHFENAPEAFTKPSAADKEFLQSTLSDKSRLFLVAEIEGIVVDEKHRASSVGTTLMRACVKWADSQGAQQIRLEVMAFNQTAQKFYEKLGFKDHSHIMSKLIN